MCCFVANCVFLCSYTVVSGIGGLRVLCVDTHVRCLFTVCCSCLLSSVCFVGSSLCVIAVDGVVGLFTYSPLHIVVCRLGSCHAVAFGLLPTQSSSGLWPYPLSPGLAVSALVCLDFVFHLLSFVMYFVSSADM